MHHQRQLQIRRRHAIADLTDHQRPAHVNHGILRHINRRQHVCAVQRARFRRCALVKPHSGDHAPIQLFFRCSADHRADRSIHQSRAARHAVDHAARPRRVDHALRRRVVDLVKILVFLINIIQRFKRNAFLPKEIGRRRYFRAQQHLFAAHQGLDSIQRQIAARHAQSD